MGTGLRQDINVPAENTRFSGNIRFQIHSFEFINRETKKWPGKKLRFTLTWVLEFTDSFDHERKYGEDIEGCLMHRNVHGELFWSPPMTRAGAYFKHTVWISQDYYNDILARLSNSPYAKMVGRIMPDLAAATKPQDEDPSLPMEINI